MTLRSQLARPADDRSTRPGRALDWLNFSLADVIGGFGPFLGIYLLTVQHWNQARIGVLMTASGLLGLLVQAPMGALIDATRFKRAAVVAAVTVLGVGAAAIPMVTTFGAVLPIKLGMDFAGALLPPAVAALTLGVTAPAGLARRFGRNGAFDHGGNVLIALAAAAVAAVGSQRAVFHLVPLCAIAATIAVLAIPASSIDHRRARGLDASRAESAPESALAFLKMRPLLVFAACAALFHFANAPMLPLVGQKLALTNHGEEAQLMSACIVSAQAVMLLCAAWAGKSAQRHGYKPILLVAFAVLPIRGLLYTLSDPRLWLLGVQLLDGVGAGIFGVLAPLALADLTRGTGRYNVASGVVATGQGVGASLSNAFAGLMTVHLGYHATFAALAGVAALALALLVFAMPGARRPGLAGVGP